MRPGLIAAFVVAGAVAASGHHSISAVYDRSRPVTLDGVVVEFAMVHPHPFIVVEVKTGSESERWRGEMDNRGELLAIGMDASTLRPGERVLVRGSQARSQPRALYVIRLDRPADGFWYEQTGMSPRIGTSTRSPK